MRIYIPTAGRVSGQDTYASLSGTEHERVLVCDAHEASLFRRTGASVLVRPDGQRIAQTRQWIVDNTDDDVIIMMDDDLVFALRRKDDPTKFTHGHVGRMAIIDSAITEMACHAIEYGHSAIAPREGANRRTELTVENTRNTRALAYSRKALRDVDAHFDDMELMEDFHVALRLLTQGYKSVTVNWMVQNQRSSNASGGCSAWRTPEMQTAAANKLATLYPPFVKVVQKETKTAWGGGTRTDVMVQWKKAYEYGRSK